jgi:hypothetical protein
MRWNRSIVLIVLSLIGVGCHRATDPLDDLSSRFSAALCNRLAACCIGLPGSQGETALRQPGGCPHWVAYNAGLEDEGVEDAVAAGRLKHDSAAGDACIARLEGLSCADFMPKDWLMCDGVISGQVAVGSACGGPPYSTFPECSSPDAWCGYGTCTPELGIGQMCADAAGTFVGPCGAGLVCDAGGTMGPSFCVTPGGVGQPCSTDSACTGSYCNISGTAGACSSPVLQLGQPCDTSDACLEGYCSPVPPGGITGTCVPKGRVGEQCFGSGPVPCVEGAWCNGETCTSASLACMGPPMRM